MIAKDFVEQSDKLIEAFKALRLSTGNGNVIIAKPVLHVTKGKGLIITSSAHQTRELKRSGFGRIISIPNNLDPSKGDMDLKVGNYCFYTFASENPIYRPAFEDLAGMQIREEFLTFTSDAEIIIQVPSEFVPITFASEKDVAA